MAVPRSMTGRLEQVDQPRLIYFNGLHSEESLVCSSFQQVIAFYISATGTLSGSSSFNVYIIGIFSNSVFRSELLVV